MQNHPGQAKGTHQNAGRERKDEDGPEHLRPNGANTPAEKLNFDPYIRDPHYVPKKANNYNKVKRNHKGVVFIRNLRPMVKTNFKTAVVSRGDTMADVIEALMVLYTNDPKVINKILPGIKKSRKG